MSGGIGVSSSVAGATDVRTIGVGMLGYAFMGKAHANGYRTLPYMAWPPPLYPGSSRSPGATRRRSPRQPAVSGSSAT